MKNGFCFVLPAFLTVAYRASETAPVQQQTSQSRRLNILSFHQPAATVVGFVPFVHGGSQNRALLSSSGF
ncbi:hypothetical protein RRG08_053171 [Elysia crispata]|uniref:Secreted protein n=1 Tax=Elysia crispata TaxID=231223 RepID=A0AAE1D3Q1_9GAST|nr:hypothetical protein RRG08_053171 [Elysia crispata]